MIPSARRRLPAAAAASPAILALWVALWAGATGAMQRGAPPMPALVQDVAFAALAAGEFNAALEAARRDYAAGTRSGDQRWIDSVAPATAIGEALYELGSLREAVTAYEEAILLSAIHGDWLLAVQFPAQGPQAAARPRVATWGRSARGTRPASMPDVMSIRRGGGDPQQVLKQGGVLSAPVNVPIRPHDVMRGLVIALYRRGAILGPLAAEGTAIDEINTALAKRPAPPGHWSQAWIDVAQGTAAWSQGRLDQAAQLLERGLAIGGKLDHPLTPWGLIVAGRIRLERNDAVAAARLFEEATYAAAEFADARALEEAFRLAFAAHRVAGTPGVPSTVQGGCEWARNGLPVLRGTLLAAEAEVSAVAGNAKAGAARLAEIDPRLLRGEAGRGRLGASAAHAAALVSYAAGDAAAGDGELTRALRLAASHAPRPFRVTRLTETVAAGAGTLSDRQADSLFASLLADPPPREFVADPLGSLVALATPRQEAHDVWEIVASRRGPDAALSAAESSLRARWMASQPAGGRRTSFARLLGTDADGLPRESAAVRAGLLERHPAVARSLEEEARLRTGLSRALLARAQRGPEADGEAKPADGRSWEEFAAVAARRDAAIGLLAAAREPVAVAFPPALPPAEIRARLRPDEAILSFRWTAAGVRGSLETRDRVVQWPVREPAAVVRELAALAKALCLFDPHVAVPTDRILASDWRAHAATLERLLFEASKVNLGEGIADLAVVPDGPLWYLPFEVLPLGSAADPDDAAEPSLLRDRLRLRYAPTRSLAVAGVPAGRAEAAPTGAVAVHAGTPPRGEKPELAADAARRLAASVDRGVLLTAAGGRGPLLEASLCESLVILDEIDLAADGRPLFARGADRSGRGGGTFGDWLAAPPKRPERVVLAGCQTAMAGGLGKPVARPGEELFLAATDLLAAGARTAILSRWRVGGKSSTDLLAEFLRDCEDPSVAPATSWARAVDVVTPEEPDPALEGRIRVAGQSVLPDLRHPFFWAGYLLVDGGTSSPAPAAGAPEAKPGAARDAK